MALFHHLVMAYVQERMCFRFFFVSQFKRIHIKSINNVNTYRKLKWEMVLFHNQVMAYIHEDMHVL